MSFLSRIRTRTARLIVVAMVGLGIPVLSSVVATPAMAAVQVLSCPGGTYQVTNGVLGYTYDSICSGAVILDDSVTTLYPFGFDSGATSITIPATTINITNIPFVSWSSGTVLESITVAADNPNYKSIDGVLYSKDGTTLIQYPANKAGADFTVPAGVTTIEPYAFGCLGNLKNLTFSDSVSTAENIGGGFGCGINSLTSYIVSSGNASFSTVDGVLFNKTQTIQMAYPTSKAGSHYTMLNTVTSLESNSFGSSKNLKTVDLSDHLVHIAQFSFYNLNLATLNIPASVSTIDGWGLDSIQSLTVDPLNTHFVMDDGVLFNFSKTQLIFYFNQNARTSYTVPSTVTSLADYVFGNFEARSIVRLTLNTPVDGGYGMAAYGTLKFLTLGNNFTSSSHFLLWYFDSLLKVNYCGTDAQTIADINAKIATPTWNHARLVCETTTPSFSLSSQAETATVDTVIRGYSITSTIPADYYTISPALTDYGLSFDSATGQITGTPTTRTSAPVQYTITGSNSFGESSTVFTLNVQNPPPFAISPTNGETVTGQVGIPLTAQIYLAGGGIPETSTVTSGSLPSGLVLNSHTGLISGTPLVAGSSLLSIEVADFFGETSTVSSLNFTIAAAPVVIPPVIPPVPVVSTPVPDPAQTGVVTSSSQTCAATGNSIVLTGSFAAPISLLTINGAAVSASSWKQTATTVTISYSATSDGSVAIQIYNGQSPVLNVVTFAYTATCPAPVLPVVPPVAPVVPPVVVPVVPPVDVPVVVPVVEPVVTPTPTPKPTTPTVSNPKIYFAVSFGFNSSKITSSQLALITKSAKLLKGTVKISGFRSQTQPGMDKTLATARANAVLAALKKLLPKGKFVITASYSAISNVCTKLVPKANNQCAVVFATS